MALTPEQRALLELVRDRGLTYEEIGELIGTNAGDARRRVRAAEAADRRAPFGLILALASLGLLAGVLAVAGVFSGDGDEVATPPITEPAAADQEVARIELSGTRGGAEGSVVIGIGADDSPYLDLDLTGLEPAPAGRFHMIWVDIARGRGVPLPDPLAVEADGNFSERLTLSPETAGILEFGRALEVVLTDPQAIEAVTREAARAERTSPPGELDPADLPRRPGQAVLRGPFPG